MPLPQQVIEQLGQETVKTPGWFSGLLFFSGSILAIMVAIYFGITIGYDSYLNSSIVQTKGQIATLSQSISSSDQASLIAYYSEVSNLHSLVTEHVLFSNFLAWLEENTEANVYYGSLNFASGNEVTLNVFAKTQADVNQQLSIFDNSSEVSAASVSSISFSQSSGEWMFNVTLVLNPSLFLWQSPTSTALTVASGTLATSTLPVASTTANPLIPAATTTSQ